MASYRGESEERNSHSGRELQWEERRTRTATTSGRPIPKRMSAGRAKLRSRCQSMDRSLTANIAVRARSPAGADTQALRESVRKRAVRIEIAAAPERRRSNRYRG